MVFCGFLLIGTVYAFGCPKNYGGYDYPGFIDEDRRCPGPEFPIKKLNTAIIHCKSNPLFKVLYVKLAASECHRYHFLEFSKEISNYNLIILEKILKFHTHYFRDTS